MHTKKYSMADALVSIVVEGLCAIAKDEVGLLVGVKKELKRLSSSFTAIQAGLEDAENQQVTKKAVRDWLGKLKDVAYEMEDILEEWRIEALELHGDEDDIFCAPLFTVLPCLQFPCLGFKQVEIRHDIGHKIREIIERLSEISTEKSSFNFNEASTSERPKMNNERETASLIVKSVIFGRDAVKEEIVNELASETSKEKRPFSVVSIGGIGGLGKTTLAQLVFNDERIKKHFEKRIWVCVSGEYDVNKILKKVIQSMGGSTDGDLDLDTLLHRINAVCAKNRFLLVLDDVWDGKLWDKLRVPLEGAAPGSRIVVTTRDGIVANAMETTFHHDLGILSDPDDWKLFTSEAFRGRNEEEWPPELIELGKQIVRKCKGVPLAIKAVGSLLKENSTEGQWQKVLISETWEWKSPVGVDIIPALLLSYYNLPIHLKQCLSFCSLFPKDYELEKDELVTLWMAHGIIKSERGEIEVIGKTYFDDLLTRSLFQDAEKDDEGNVFRCKMHDLVHDLARFVTTGDYCSMEIGNPSLPSVNCHHLSLLVNFDVSSIPSPLCSAEHLRTLLLFGSSTIEELPHSLFNHLKFLRTLDLSSTCIENLPSSLGKLKHLRYLDLSRLYITELPESVTDLCNLQTLKLNACWRLCLLPSGMSKMVELRHLDLSSTKIENLPSSLGKLKHLRYLNLSLTGIRELPESVTGLCNLQILKLDRCMSLCLLPSGMSKMDKLRHLDLSGTAIKELPESVTDLCNLQTLRLSDCMSLCLMSSDMSKMVELRHLNLSGLNITELPESVSDLCSLQTLKLDHCRSLCLLPSGMSKMVKLRHLEIEKTDDLAFLPSGIGRLSSLRTLCKFPVGDENNRGCKIGELKNLNLLRGELRIENLEKVINPVEAKEAELDQKCHLQCLNLECNDMREEEWGMLGEVEMEKMKIVFEGLRPPHSNLQSLSIENYAGSKFPSWWEVAEFSSLRIVQLRNCKKCTLLPGLGKLPWLEELTLDGADEIKVVGGDFYGNGNEGGGKGIAFPKLKKLYLWRMSNWEEWKLTKEDGEVMPSLEKLDICECKKLKALPNCLPNTLRQVKIVDCNQVIWAPDNPLPVVEYLLLSGDVRGNPLPCLPALKNLRIGFTSIESLPYDGWGLLESLNTLEFFICDGLASLPNGLGQLKSLHKLDIFNCPKLRLLPNLQHLTAVEEIRINMCPLVTERLEKEKGEDWCNISHIPYIEIDGERIQ